MRMLNRLVRLAASGLILAGAATAAGASELRADTACTVAREMRGFAGDLAASRSLIADGGKLTVVALGSSSTFGVGSSSQDRTYPAILRQELGRLLPGHQIEVVNAGIAGNSAHQMYQRIDDDVLGEEPKLVIWQTGIFDAINDVGIDRFKRILRKGIAKLREAGVDVVLMDQIPLPRMERFPSYPAYVAALHEVAVETGTPVFRRNDMVAMLLGEGRLRPEEVLPAEGQQHQVDASYYCVGVNLARTLAEKLSPRAVPEVAVTR